MDCNQLSDEQMASYAKLCHKPLDNTLYDILHINPAMGFDRKVAKTNMALITKELQSDEIECSKIVYETWRFLNNPRREILYRIVGRAEQPSCKEFDWSNADKYHQQITLKWQSMSDDDNNSTNAQHNESENITSQTNSTKRKLNDSDDQDLNSHEKRNRIAQITRIVDHTYKHKKYLAIVEWDDGDKTKISLDETINHGNILQNYLLYLMKSNSKRYNWLRKNQPQLFGVSNKNEIKPKIEIKQEVKHEKKILFH